MVQVIYTLILINMKARIINGNDLADIYTEEFLVERWDTVVNGQLVSEWELTEILPNPEWKQPKWNGVDWFEAYVEVILVPEEISKMALSLELFDRGITDQDIFDDIDSVPNSIFPLVEKERAKIKYITARSFVRSNMEVNLVATMEGLSQNDVDQIFINGKSR